MTRNGSISLVYHCSTHRILGLRFSLQNWWWFDSSNLNCCRHYFHLPTHYRQAVCLTKGMSTYSLVWHPFYFITSLLMSLGILYSRHRAKQEGLVGGLTARFIQMNTTLVRQALLQHATYLTCVPRRNSCVN